MDFLILLSSLSLLLSLSSLVLAGGIGAYINPCVYYGTTPTTAKGMSPITFSFKNGHHHGMNIYDLNQVVDVSHVGITCGQPVYIESCLTGCKNAWWWQDSLWDLAFTTTGPNGEKNSLSGSVQTQFVDGFFSNEIRTRSSTPKVAICLTAEALCDTTKVNYHEQPVVNIIFQPLIPQGVGHEEL